MADWIRQLIRSGDAASQWHVARDKGYATTTFCGQRFEGPIEVTMSDDRVERDGHCATCEARVSERQAAVTGAARSD